MSTESFTFRIYPAADMHIHLRQSELCKALTQSLVHTGVDTFLVMPNLIPPLTNTEMVLKYHQELKTYAPKLNFLMTLYLSPELTPDEIRKAKKAGIVGVKSYPRGVTTNSEFGIENYDIYYPVFKAMEEEDMVLNLHGECPSDPTTNITVLNAETRFLEHLERIHTHFPNLRIVLEHVTTAQAVDKVCELGPTVVSTITVHHLFLTIEDWMNQPHCFCKPVAKTYEDRMKLQSIVLKGYPKFFLGTDSAPHPKQKKESPYVPAGVFTSPYTLIYLAHFFHQANQLLQLEKFACVYGRQFYKLPLPQQRTIELKYCPLTTSLSTPNTFKHANVIESSSATNQSLSSSKGDAVREEVRGTGTIVETMKVTLEEKNQLIEIVPLFEGKHFPWTISVLS